MERASGGIHQFPARPKTGTAPQTTRKDGFSLGQRTWKQNGITVVVHKVLGPLQVDRRGKATSLKVGFDQIKVPKKTRYPNNLRTPSLKAAPNHSEIAFSCWGKATHDNMVPGTNQTPFPAVAKGFYT